MRRMTGLVALLAVWVATLAVPAHAQRRGPLVLAAASLQGSLDAAADAWTRKGHARPVLSFAASSALARQIEAGGGADLFISADQQWMDALAAKRLIVADSRANLVGNRLVIVATRANRTRMPLAPAALARTLSTGPLAMADAPVPAGRYGEAALRSLGVWTRVAPHVVRGDSVRAALALVERGAAPFGIVYATDAAASGSVRVAGVFPPRTYPPITYPLARLAASADPEAEGFRRFLLGGEAQAIFRRHGFTAAR